MQFFDLGSDLEAKSKYGVPHPSSFVWYWAENEGRLFNYAETGVYGSLRALTEMEALDRLREAFPQVKALGWVYKSHYDEKKQGK